MHTREKYWNRRVAAALAAALLFNFPLMPATASELPHFVSSAQLPGGLKEDYLKRICKNNLLMGLFTDSYYNWLTGSYSGFSEQYWNQFSTDAQNLIRNNHSGSKWLKKNIKRFPSSARKSVQTYIDSNNAQVVNIQAILSSKNNEDLASFEFNNWSRGQSLTANASGKIRKALRLPPRGSDDGCP